MCAIFSNISSLYLLLNKNVNKRTLKTIVDLNVLILIHNYPLLSRSLDLSFNNITDIQAGFFEPLASILKILNLAHNQLRLVTASGLGNLRRLVHLDLSHNRLEAVEETALEMNRDLQRLSLASNLLTSIERQSFRNLRHLVRLDLSRNDLDTLPEGLFEVECP